MNVISLSFSLSSLHETMHKHIPFSPNYDSITFYLSLTCPIVSRMHCCSFFWIIPLFLTTYRRLISNEIHTHLTLFASPNALLNRIEKAQRLETREQRKTICETGKISHLMPAHIKRGFNTHFKHTNIVQENKGDKRQTFVPSVVAVDWVAWKLRSRDVLLVEERLLPQLMQLLHSQPLLLFAASFEWTTIRWNQSDDKERKNEKRC